MDDKNVTTNEIMDFLQENMVTKEEFYNFKDEVNQKFESIDQRFNQQKLDFIDALDEKLGEKSGFFISNKY